MKIHANPCGRGSGTPRRGCPLFLANPYCVQGVRPSAFSRPSRVYTHKERHAVRHINHRRGSALLTVLWLSAALSAIAFSVAITVRSETERTATAAEGVRAYYLATGAIDRAILYMMWGPGHVNPDGTPRYYKPGQPRFEFDFPTGHASVELIPESAKLNINTAPPEDLARLFLAAGLPPEPATEMAAAVLDWRSGGAPGVIGPFDQFYLSRAPSFRARHASFEEIEELLFIKGMTPELFHGSYQRTPEGRLVPVGGLRDCLSVWGGFSGFDINSAHPILMNSLGIPVEVVAAIVERRARQPFLNANELLPIQQSAGPGAGKLRIGGNATFTIRATATIGIPAQAGQPPRLSDIRRSVAAVIRFNYEPGSMEPYTVLRWYDNAGKR